MKRIIWFSLVLLFSGTAFAQKETFDVLSYAVPRGWQQQTSDRGVQLSVTDKATNSYALAILTRATAATGTAAENFKAQWANLVQGSVTEAGEPTLAAPAQGNGWDILSGTGNYTDQGVRGVAILLSATGHGRTVSVILMTNTQRFQNELAALLQSLDLAKPVASEPVIPATSPTVGLAGLWVYYNSETNGRFSNGSPMLTAGYLRREYLLKPDGTYIYRFKSWSIFVKNICFALETGTWQASGNQVTFTPTQGESGWWAKAPSGRTTEWGARVEPASWKLESVTYTFELHYYSGMQETHLLLTHAQPTTRDGPDNPANYSPRALDKSLIDNPPDL